MTLMHTWRNQEAKHRRVQRGETQRSRRRRNARTYSRLHGDVMICLAEAEYLVHVAEIQATTSRGSQELALRSDEGAIK